MYYIQKIIIAFHHHHLLVLNHSYRSVRQGMIRMMSHIQKTRRRLCSKKKVLILGLDGVGKTDLFRQLVSEDKPGPKKDSVYRPTLGKFR